MKSAAKLLLSLQILATSALAEGSVTWQQVGGSLSTTPTHKGMAGQGYQTTPMDQLQSGFLAHPLLVNTPPFVVSGLPDLVKPMGFGKVLVLLDTVFSDIDGDALSYSVQDSGTGTVAVVHGDSLWLSGTPGASGTSRIVVRASDASDAALDTFAVVVEPTTALAARPVAIKRSTELAVSIPNPLAAPAQGAGVGRLGIGSGADGGNGLSVNLLLPQAAFVSVSIFDNQGAPVISFAQDIGVSDLRRGERTGDGRWALPVSWNLRSTTGVPVPAGVYLWKIEAVAADGQKLQCVKNLGVKEAKR